VQVETRPGSTPEQVIVDVDVVEQPTGSFGFGGSFSISSGLGLLINFQESNFLGRGQRLSFDFDTTRDTRSANLSFVEPFFLGRNLAFGLDALLQHLRQRQFGLQHPGHRPTALVQLRPG
jgi:outer membrane protein insertion porin family